MAIGAYPGSFDPPTVAHLAIAESALRACSLARLDLVLSEEALGKEHAHARLADRIEVLRAMAATRPWLGVAVTAAKLLVDVADGYDVIVMGADKWSQVVDPAWYGGSDERRDAALDRLPRPAVAPRQGWPVPPGVTALLLDEDHGQVSSTAVRDGNHDWLTDEAAAFAAMTGAWIEPERYERWLMTTH